MFNTAVGYITHTEIQHLCTINYRTMWQYSYAVNMVHNTTTFVSELYHMMEIFTK